MIRTVEILEIAKSEGKVLVDDLAQRFGVTTQTIRRDLADLAETGKLERVHGGAVMPSGVVNLDYVQRQELNAAGKARIGRACAAHVPENASIFVNIGTTNEAVSRELLSHKNLLIVTNSLNSANIISANPDCDIIVAGGNLRRSDGGLLGNLTTQVVDLFKFDLAIISCAGIDEEGDLLEFDLQEVHATKAILRQAKSTFVVADQTKIGRTAPGRIGNLASVTKVFTDAPLPLPINDLCSESETEMIVC
ncbi:DeoR/GlpR family DNA-binding transcription regulator [Shimia thalassica]|uniref:DeoR/GlpR family DNA-binding transcription regulator n=1 Tax=Shimia thalassica TaxID=1715693 RepID=UPI0026E1A387|nr:DeoR/GlpR family DNA-binding transcription regulator [Shimia thalassica]MDO6481337.1 DeoR/GlpR family DNA-binding transcription regulator [Shimia thalassica]